MLVRPAAGREAVGDACDTLSKLYDDGREAVGEGVERVFDWSSFVFCSLFRKISCDCGYKNKIIHDHSTCDRQRRVYFSTWLLLTEFKQEDSTTFVYYIHVLL